MGSASIPLKVRFWGTRGSLPTSIKAHEIRGKIASALAEAIRKGLRDEASVERFIDEELPFHVSGCYGSNTACVEIHGGPEHMICDAGTGLRDLGNSAAKTPDEKLGVFNIFLSHPHWDHIQGFPFFVPAYVPGNRINIYGFHKGIESAFTEQQKAPFFPVPIEGMRAEINFITMEPGGIYDVGGFRVTGMRQKHPGDSYGYRFEGYGRKVIYSTDSEHDKHVLDPGSPIIEFFRDADIVVFDAQYSFIEAVYTKENWGHSSNILGVELGVLSNAKRLCLFHNEHTCGDEELDDFHRDTRKYLRIHDPESRLEIFHAYDGLEVAI